MGPRVDLRAVARNEALGIAGAGVLALIAGPIVLALGAVLLIGVVLGPLLILGGLFAIPFGLYRALFPMHHPALHALGASDPDRAAAIDAVEAELASPVAQRLALRSGNALAVTPRFFVVHGRVLVIARREDLLWGYGKLTTRTRWGVTTGRTHEVCFVTRRTGEHLLGTRDERESAAALALFAVASPRALVGYRDALKALPVTSLAAQVDRVPWVSTPIDGAIGALPSTSVPGAYPAGVSTSPLWWALVIAGIATAGSGLLSAMAFGWIATHPHQPDDVRFGSFFSIASVLVCFGPGLLAAALAAWRLFARSKR